MKNLKVSNNIEKANKKIKMYKTTSIIMTNMTKFTCNVAYVLGGGFALKELIINSSNPLNTIAGVVIISSCATSSAFTSLAFSNLIENKIYFPFNKQIEKQEEIIMENSLFEEDKDIERVRK